MAPIAIATIILRYLACAQCKVMYLSLNRVRLFRLYDFGRNPVQLSFKQVDLNDSCVFQNSETSRVGTMLLLGQFRQKLKAWVINKIRIG